MIGMLAESIVVAFILGGVIGSITTMHIHHASEMKQGKKVTISIRQDQDSSE